MKRIEQLAADTRQQLGIRGYPGLAGVHALVRLLSASVRYVPTPGEPNGCCCHRDNGARATVWADPSAIDTLTHELAHSLLGVGLADWLARNGVRTAKLQHAREERVAEAFTLAFLLPADLCASPENSNADIVDGSGCSLAMVRQRRKELAALWR